MSGETLMPPNALVTDIEQLKNGITLARTKVRDLEILLETLEKQANGR